jgi:hypothetical protein
LGPRPLMDGLDLCGIHGDASRRDGVAEVGDEVHTEGAL